jgi:competence protein ComEA
MSPLGTRLAAFAGRDDDHWPAAGRLRWGGWPGPALRMAGLLLAAGAVVGGWWWWSGRPSAVVPVVGTSPSALPTPTPSSPAPVSVPGTSLTALEPASPPAVTPVPSASAPEAPVVVHVTGLVHRPGLVTLAAGARVADAVAAAGGVTKPRAADTVNLARPVVDGEQIAVGAAAAGASRAVPPAPAPAGGGQPMPAATPVDLNTATVEALDALPGLGPVLSGRIVEWRAAHGLFRSVDELGEVVGIGPALVERLRPHVRV